MEPTIAPRVQGFNSRSRVGSDTHPEQRKAQGNRFNSRSRVGSDGMHASGIAVPVLFQFTLPCRERQASTDAPDGAAPVSIHAPV